MDNQTRRDAELPYIADMPVLLEMQKTRKLLFQLNTTNYSDFLRIKELVGELLGESDNAFISPPFYCDYGTHIKVGKNFSANFNCTILDVGTVTIGDNCMLGPNVAIYTAGHPVHPEARNSGYEYGIPVTIGDNVWIGGSSVITPGITIGSNTVIGAGSVVTRDIPEGVVAAGNPCKVIRAVTDEDRHFYYKNRPFDEEAWAIIGKGGKP